MKNPVSFLRRWIPLLVWALWIAPAFSSASYDDGDCYDGPVIRLAQLTGEIAGQLKLQGFSISSVSDGQPSTSYPSALGFPGFISQARQDIFERGVGWIFAGLGKGLGTLDSSVIGVSATTATGDFYAVGYGDTSNTAYTNLSGFGHFQAVANGGYNWTGALTSDGGLPAGILDSAYTGVSANGLSGIGYSFSTTGTVPFVYPLTGSAPIFLHPPTGVTYFKPRGISADATVIVGDDSGLTKMGAGYFHITVPNSTAAGAYTFTGIGSFPGATSTLLSGVSPDAKKFLVNAIDSTGNEHEVVFDPATNTFVDIRAGAAADSRYGEGFGMNHNGSVVVGYGTHGTTADYWTAKGGIQVLPALNGMATCVAECISSDSAFIGGASFQSNFGGAGVAQLWGRDGTTYNLQTLCTLLGQDTTGWTLNQVTSIVHNSDNSYLIAGGATVGGLPQAFVVELEFPPVPVISAQPANQIQPSGSNAVFAVAASAATSYQWQKNGVPISGATASTLTLSKVQAADAGTYSVLITNSNGTTLSAAATLSVNAAGAGPTFAVQPVSQTIAGRATVVFNAAATAGSSAPNYQWQLNGTNIVGATSARLVLSNPTAANAGTYVCVATASGSSATSSPAALTLTGTANPGRLINLSVNTTAGKSQVLTVGFVVGGSGTTGTQSLLLRATGPALAALGVSNVLADPALTVFAGSASVAANDNWGTPAGNQAAVTAADAATFAFPLTNPSSLDAALVTALASGGYTVQISGNTAAAGTTLAEVYDNTPAGAYTLTTPRLINLSSNNQIAAKGSMTAGFVVGGTTSKTVLVRATGPALTALGVAGAIPDPQLALHGSVNGADTVLATNAGWGGDPQITAAGNAVFAFPLTNPASKDSVLLLTLAPGSYTALASSVSGAAGVVLIEIYEVP